MFEGLVADLVTRVCGDYVEGLDKGNLNISIWSGELVVSVFISGRG
jgi:hypothetical protein